jgi:CRISPR-associated protein Cmr1
VTDREAWLPGGEMSLSLASRRLPADRPPLSKDVLVSLWLLCNLGGLGARTRRGAGAIQAAQVDPPWPEDLPPLSSTAESPVDLANKLGAALRQLLQLTSGSPAPSLTVPSLHPGALDIYVVAPRQPWTAAKALEDVGRKFMQFRHQYAVDHKNTDGPVVKNFANTGSVPATVQRAALGLPLPFFYRDTGSRVTVSGTVGDEDVERSSSPLHFRVVPLANDTYTVVLLFFKTPLLPTGGQLLLKSGRQVGRANAPDQTIIDEYLAQDGLLKVNYE